jgi:hypothetical protein
MCHDWVWTNAEYNCFEYFRHNTAKDLSGYFDTDIWNRLILQICYTELFARHAAIAIGALTKSASVSAASICGNTKTGEGSARHHYEFALKQYAKAIRFMQNISRQQPVSLRSTLVSGLLTTCFESCIGNQDNAIMQVEIGVNLLAGHQHYHGIGEKNAFLDDDLLYTFTRLGAQISMFKKRPATPTSHELKPNTLRLSPFLRKLPLIFDSVKKARIYWDIIVTTAMQWKVASHANDLSTVDLGENNMEICGIGPLCRQDTGVIKRVHYHYRAMVPILRNPYSIVLTCPKIARTSTAPVSS